MMKCNIHLLIFFFFTEFVQYINIWMNIFSNGLHYSGQITESE